MEKRRKSKNDEPYCYIRTMTLNLYITLAKKQHEQTASSRLSSNSFIHLFFSCEFCSSLNSLSNLNPTRNCSQRHVASNELIVDLVDSKKGEPNDYESRQIESSQINDQKYQVNFFHQLRKAKERQMYTLTRNSFLVSFDSSFNR